MADLEPLDPAEQRVLGALLEKETTVPATYPLSLNALRTACNQATSREPVTAYTDDELQAVTLRLQERRLVRLVREHGGRTVKYAQRLAETLGVDGPERAVLTVLLLRGAQAAGELKTRTERLHPFADRAEVEDCLAALAAATPPLVRELPRAAGQHDNRWIHLLGPVEVPTGTDRTGGVPFEGWVAGRAAELGCTAVTVVAAGTWAGLAPESLGDAVAAAAAAEGLVATEWYLSGPSAEGEGPRLHLLGHPEGDA